MRVFTVLLFILSMNTYSDFEAVMTKYLESFDHNCNHEQSQRASQLIKITHKDVNINLLDISDLKRISLKLKNTAQLMSKTAKGLNKEDVIESTCLENFKSYKKINQHFIHYITDLISWKKGSRAYGLKRLKLFQNRKRSLASYKNKKRKLERRQNKLQSPLTPIELTYLLR